MNAKQLSCRTRTLLKCSLRFQSWTCVAAAMGASHGLLFPLHFHHQQLLYATLGDAGLVVGGSLRSPVASGGN